MQDATMQSAMQPFTKLAQANMDLMTKFSLSPEVTSQAMNDAQKLFQQAQDSAAKLTQSNAFAGFMEGLMKNFNEFFTELTQSGTAMLSQGQAALMHQVQDATGSVVDATQAGARRARPAA